MRGILINAEERMVTAVDVNPDPNESLNGMRELIKCEFVEAFRFTDNLTMWIDEEGKLKLPKAGFMFIGVPVEIAGNGLLLGETSEGDCVDCNVPVEIVRVFHNMAFARRSP